MKKAIAVYSLLLFVMLFQACVPKKPLYSNPQPTTSRVVEPPQTKDPYVPFTRELFDKLSANNIDVKLVQFYIDQQLVLTRNLNNDQVTVKNGVIKFNNFR